MTSLRKNKYITTEKKRPLYTLIFFPILCYQCQNIRTAKNKSTWRQIIQAEQESQDVSQRTNQEVSVPKAFGYSVCTQGCSKNWHWWDICYYFFVVVKINKLKITSSFPISSWGRGGGGRGRNNERAESIQTRWKIEKTKCRQRQVLRWVYGENVLLMVMTMKARLKKKIIKYFC